MLIDEDLKAGFNHSLERFIEYNATVLWSRDEEEALSRRSWLAGGTDHLGKYRRSDG